MSVANAALPNAERMEVFPVTIMKCYWPESETLNAELKSVILARSSGRLGLSRSNVGGHQSEPGMEDWPEPCVKELLRRIDMMICELIIRMVDNPSNVALEGWNKEVWANINRHGHYNRSHNHTRDNNLWSGIYSSNLGTVTAAQSSPPVA